MPRDAGRSGAAWRRVRSQVLAQATVCSICGRALDFEAPPRSRWAPSADHMVSNKTTRRLDEVTRRQMALDPSNLRPTHYGCNSRRGAGQRRVVRKTSRRW